MGSAKVGKTSIVNRIVGNNFQDKYKPTVYDEYEKEMDSEDGYFVFRLIDTSGTYRFPAMQRLSISKSDIFIVVYKVKDRESLNEAKNAIEEISVTKRAVGGKGPPIILVGNKLDLLNSEFEVSGESPNDACGIENELEEKCFSHLMVSAKSGTNIVFLLKFLAVGSERLCIEGLSFKRQHPTF